MTRSMEDAHPLQARKQEVVRGAIWDAAVDLFARTGFEETTIDEIARAAGVSTRTFFRYFSSKNDLLAQGMVGYRSLLTHAIRSAPEAFQPLQIVRHVVEHVVAQVVSHPRSRHVIRIASTSAAAREAQLSRRGEVENGIAQEFALKCRTARHDDITPRLLAALTLTIIDVTLRGWATRGHRDVRPITGEVFSSLTRLLSDQPGAADGARAARSRRPPSPSRVERSQASRLT